MTPAPYYDHGGVTLYLGDCREVTEWLSADVLVTDPPYGIAYESTFSRDPRNRKQGRPIAGDSGIELRDVALSRWGNRPAWAT